MQIEAVVVIHAVREEPKLLESRPRLDQVELLAHPPASNPKSEIGNPKFVLPHLPSCSYTVTVVPSNFVKLNPLKSSL
jgi:hypothetical protein